MGTTLLGSSKCGDFLQNELELLHENGITTPQIDVYPQLYVAKKKRTITALSSSKATKRVDSCVAFLSADILSFGLVLKLIQANSQVFAIIRVLNEVADLTLCKDKITSSKFSYHYRAFYPPRCVCKLDM
jgi:hypothetical protein